MKINNVLFLIVLILLSIYLARKLRVIEGAATSPATLTQLSASSVYQPIGWNPHLRPVNQRGMFFHNPSWTRM